MTYLCSRSFVPAYLNCISAWCDNPLVLYMYVYMCEVHEVGLLGDECDWLRA